MTLYPSTARKGSDGLITSVLGEGIFDIEEEKHMFVREKKQYPYKDTTISKQTK